MKNITFIGMSGAGKSTIGKLFAKRYSLHFVDIDALIEEETGQSIPTLIEQIGEDAFIKKEESAVLSLNLNNDQGTVISPGGSIIYSYTAMNFLKKGSIIIYLETYVEEIKKRLEHGEKKLIWKGAKTLDELIKQRKSLYERYADMTVVAKNKTAEDIVNELKVI